MSETEVATSARPRCRIHHIALGGDGRCVLCRRKHDDIPEEPRSPWKMIFFFTVVSLFALAAYAVNRETSRTSQNMAQPVQNKQNPRSQVRPIRKVVPKPAQPTTRKGYVDRQKQYLEDQAEREELLAIEMNAVPVTMYSTTACKRCSRAREWFAEKPYSFTDLDVDSDGRNARARDKLNPKKSVPTLQIGDVVLLGFDPKAVERAIRTEAAKALE